MMKKGDWQESSANSVTKIAELASYLELTPEVASGLEQVVARYPLRLSPYTAALMDPRDETCSIRRQFLPDVRELQDPWGSADPLLEEERLVAKQVIKAYPDRVATLISHQCASYCRFCFRKTRVQSTPFVTTAEREEALSYIAQDKSIRDVLVTGGDPLLLPDEILADFLKKLRAIKHVEIIRLGSRVLSTLPQRITHQLAAMLAQYHPVWLNFHFNHPKELTPAAAAAADILLSRGIPLGNQSVLLKGINDDLETMKTLQRGLLKMRIRPYCLYQCHLIEGTAHFRTAIETGLNLIAGLRGQISGLAIPSFILDTPHGKVPLNPNYLLGREGEVIRCQTPSGKEWSESNPFA